MERSKYHGIGAVRPSSDQAAQIEASKARLASSRKLRHSSAEIIRETRETIGRTLEKLASRSSPDLGDKH